MQQHEAVSMALRGVQAAVGNTLIALGLTLLTEPDFGRNLLYSQLIGLSIWAFIDLGQHWIVTDWEAHWRRLVLIVPAGVMAGYLVGSVSADLLLGREPLGYWQERPRYAAGILVLSLAAGATASYYFLSRRRLAALRERELAAQRQAAESRLRLLESQLEPHMLFNTLANLRALIGMEPQRAQQMLDHLIAYLRATLSGSRAEVHTLAEEFDRLRDYLALMSVRMGPRLRYRLDLPAELAHEPVAPLLLQPLVENSLRHGLEPHVQGGSITVGARREGGTLVLEVTDTGRGAAPGPDANAGAGTGFGLAHVRERLATLHGSAATMNLIAEHAGGMRASIRFPSKK